MAPRLSDGINLVPKDIEQVQICLGVPGIPYTDERRYTQNVMNSILGEVSVPTCSRRFAKRGDWLTMFIPTLPTWGGRNLYHLCGNGSRQVREFFALLRTSSIGSSAWE